MQSYKKLQFAVNIDDCMVQKKLYVYNPQYVILVKDYKRAGTYSTNALCISPQEHCTLLCNI